MCQKSSLRSLALVAITYLFLGLLGPGAAHTFQLPVTGAAAPAAPALDPSNPLGFPRGSYVGQPGSDTVSLSSGLFQDLFPKIPNLEFGFNYAFGSNLRQSRWSIDYLLPIGCGPNATLFAEAHGESVSSRASTWVPFLNNFWQLTAPGAQSRLDLSFGIGYRRIFSQDLLVGANVFFDTTRLYATPWHSSGGYGLEMAANGPGDSAMDLTFNYYGNVYGGYNSRGSVFPTFNIVDGIQKGTANYDLEAGYSQSILDQAFDLRVKLTGYQFALNNSKKYGIKSGAEVTTADGVFRLSMEGGHDAVMGSYGNVGGYVNVGFQLENLLYGESPFSHPEPVFKSPRNLRRLLARPVKRNWFKPATVIANANCEGLPDDSLFAHPTGKSCFYVGFTQQTNQACRNAGYLIMEDTVGQQTFSNPYIGPYERPPYNYRRDAEPMWDCSSAAYSRAASGVVHAYMYSQRICDRSSTFYRVELPTLQTNPNVTSILVYSGQGPDPSAYTLVGDWKHGISPPCQ